METLIAVINPDTVGETPTSPGLMTVPDAETVDCTSPNETIAACALTFAGAG
jgi:hypothetical protein